MRDALDTLSGLCSLVRRAIGPQAERMPAACDAVVASVCKAWPTQYMTTLARRADAEAGVLMALRVVRAKAREDLEHHYGTQQNTLAALDALCTPVVQEIARLWFSSATSRAAVRRCCALARRAA